MRALLLVTILAEALFILASVWWALSASEDSTTINLPRPPLVDADPTPSPDSPGQREQENARLRKQWQRIQPSNRRAHDPDHAVTEVAFEAVLERICDACLFSIYKSGTPPALAGALDLSEGERAKIDEIWQEATDQFKKLELSNTTNGNAEIAAESAAHLAEAKPKLRAELVAEGLAPDELEARVQEFERVMTYDESGRVRLHIDSAALYKNAAPALDSLHASLTSVLKDSTRASMATEVFARLYLGGENATETTIDFLFGTDEASATTRATSVVGTENSPKGHEIPIMSTWDTTTSLTFRQVNVRFDHLIDTETRRLRSEVSREK